MCVWGETDSLALGNAVVSGIVVPLTAKVITAKAGISMSRGSDSGGTTSSKEGIVVRGILGSKEAIVVAGFSVVGGSVVWGSVVGGILDRGSSKEGIISSKSLLLPLQEVLRLS